MITKFFEVRDEGTFIPVICIKTLPGESWLLHRAGFDKEQPVFMMLNLNTNQCEYDPYKWEGGRTLFQAHKWIQTHFDFMTTDDVVDVQYICGETEIPKLSEKRIC